MGTVRTLAIVAKEDVPSRGRPILYGYGFGYLGWLGRAHRNTVRKTVRLRRLPLHNPVVAVAWGLARRGKADTAREVLRAFGLDRRFTVKHRSMTLVGH